MFKKMQRKLLVTLTDSRSTASNKPVKPALNCCPQLKYDYNVTLKFV